MHAWTLCRHGRAVDIQKDYMGTPARRGKENAEPQSKRSKADGNWPEVEIRMAGRHSGAPPALHVHTDNAKATGFTLVRAGLIAELCSHDRDVLFTDACFMFSLQSKH